MNHNKPILLVLLMIIAGSLACSFSTIQKQAQNIGDTVQTYRTDIKPIITSGKLALETIQSLSTRSAPLIGTKIITS